MSQIPIYGWWTYGLSSQNGEDMVNNGWSMVDIWLLSSQNGEYIWFIYGWYMVDIWLIYG